MPRIPSVKSCVKRLSAITITELRKLSSRDLRNILKLTHNMGMIQKELDMRGGPAQYAIEETVGTGRLPGNV